jgi:phosphate transport system substrate-binding protein
MIQLEKLKQSVFNGLLLVVGICGIATSAAEITGAGSTFVYPLLAKWAATYKVEKGTAVNYQSIGSGGGIKQIETKPEPTVDFGATDKPLTVEELAKENLIQFPIINGALVPVVNVAGIKEGELKLTGTVLADIFMGKIKKWNDPQLIALNKDAKLPNQDITVIHRSDGSGTTFIFTNYLSKVSSEWKEKFKEGTAVDWPVGVGGKGNEGVAANVKQIAGSIGYIEFAYAVQSNMTYTQMQNHEKQFVKPNDESFAAAAAGVDWAKAPGFFLIMTDAAGKKSWPIAGSTFILMQKNQTKSSQAAEALKFFKWAYTHGEPSAKELHYVPIPKKVADLIEKKWREEIKGVEFNKTL